MNAQATEGNGRLDPEDVNAMFDGARDRQALKPTILPIEPAQNGHGFTTRWKTAAAERQVEEVLIKDRFPLVSSSTLDSADYTPQWIIDDMLAAGSPAVDGGLYKTSKTLIAMDGSISIASGTDFLGRFTVREPLTVVYFIGEGGPSVTQEYGRRIAASKGLALGDVRNLHWCFSVPKLESLFDLDAIQRIHDTTAAEVMVFDNLMLCMSADEPGNVFRMGQTLSCRAALENRQPRGA
jgi:hypothetical protein